MESIELYARAAANRWGLTNDVEDLIQEGMVHACQVYHKYDPARSDDIQKFIRTRASYHIKDYASRVAQRRARECALLSPAT